MVGSTGLFIPQLMDVKFCLTHTAAFQVHCILFDNNAHQEGKGLVFPMAYYLPKTYGCEILSDSPHPLQNDLDLIFLKKRRKDKTLVLSGLRDSEQSKELFALESAVHLSC